MRLNISISDVCNGTVNSVQNNIDITLKYRRRFLETKGHSKIFEQPFVCCYGGFANVFWVHGNFMECVVDDIEAGLRIASALYWFWHIRNHKREGIDWLERVISAVPSAQVNAKPPNYQALIRGKALNVAGSLLMMQGMLEQADTFSKESLKIHEDLGLDGRQGVAHALWNLSQGAAQRANSEKARELSKKSLSLYRELNDKFGIAQCLDDLGGSYLARGEYQQAREIWEEDLNLRKELGDKDGVSGPA